MPRKAQSAAAQVVADIGTTSPPEVLAERRIVAEHAQQLATIDLQYALDSEPYDYMRTIAYLQAGVAMQVKTAIVIGRACLLIKAHEPEGRFYEALEAAGVSVSTARKYMAVVRKFDGPDQRKLLAGKLAASKLLELVTESDDALDVLADGGTLAGHTLDEIDRMTVSQLKEALRRERQERQEDKAASDEIVAKKDKKLNELSRKLRGWDRTPVRDRAEELLRSLDAEVIGALSSIKNIEEAIHAIEALHVDANLALEDDIRRAVTHSLDGIRDRLADMRDVSGF